MKFFGSELFVNYALLDQLNQVIIIIIKHNTIILLVSIVDSLYQ